MTPEQWKTCVDIIEHATGKVFAKDQISIYYRAFQSYDGQVMQSACVAFVADDKRGWLPTIGVLKSIADELIGGTNLTPEQAWARIQEAISLYGWPEPGKARKHCGEDIWEVVRGVGGWIAICDTEQRQRSVLFSQFRDGWLRHCEDRRRASILEPIRKRLNGKSKGIAVDLAKSLVLPSDDVPKLEQ